MMLERLVFTILRDRLNLLVEDPTKIRDFLVEEAQMSLEEATAIAGDIRSNPPGISHGYARTDAKFPLITVVLQDDRPSTDFLGDEGGSILNADGQAEADEWASIYRYTVNVLIYAQNPDVVVWLYHLTKWMIVEDHDFFQAPPANFLGIQLSGSDLAPDATYSPAGLFRRMLSITAERKYSQVRDRTRDGRFRTVQGIHVVPDGAIGEDVGGAVTHVTVSGNEEEEP